uniref:Uncharacterized protein n=1 Tax=Cacopsylla melanoneura TaxID=428564 RepID=A0A8D8XZS4_9HEMI
MTSNLACETSKSIPHCNGSDSAIFLGQSEERTTVKERTNILEYVSRQHEVAQIGDRRECTLASFPGRDRCQVLEELGSKPINTTSRTVWKGHDQLSHRIFIRNNKGTICIGWFWKT